MLSGFLISNKLSEFLYVEILKQSSNNKLSQQILKWSIKGFKV